MCTIHMFMHRLIVKKNMKYFYCDDNNVYTMIKYYNLYHNNCNVNYPTFYNKFKKKQRRAMEGAMPPPCIHKLSQRSIYLIFFSFLSLYLVTINMTDKFAYMVLLFTFTSRFIIYLLFNKTAQRCEVIHLIAPFTNLPFASHVFFIIRTPYNII